MFRSGAFVSIALVVLQAAGAGAAEMRYLAVLADGSRAEGDAIADWHSTPGSPRLDKIELFDPQRPLRWLRDRTLMPFDPAVDLRGFVEMINGDRLPGAVQGYEEGSLEGLWARPPYFTVRLEGTPPPEWWSYVRIRPQFVRRIVVGRSISRKYEPGTVLYSDGRRFSFRSLRWQGEKVKFLVGDEIRELTLADVAEIHFPCPKVWDALCEESAILNADLSARLVRLETTRGAILTGSESRMRAYAPLVAVPAKPGAPPPKPDTPPETQPDPDSAHWFHATQPFWAMEPIWLPFPSIRTRCYFAATELPLTRLEPARIVQRSILAKGWPAQVDRNVQGGVLQSGGQQWAWGFGVHAANELWFDLPECVQGFRTRVGLDRIAGNGGCARALLYINQPDGKPLFQSKHLIGSDQLADSGMVALSGPAGGQKSLLLVADAAEKDRPRGADPVDIRDMLDWLEPTLYFDRGKFLAEIQKCIPRVIPAWNGWEVKVEGNGSLRLWSRWDEYDSAKHRFELDVSTDNRPLVLSCARPIGPDDNWLVVRVRATVEGAGAGRMEVRLDGRPIARFAVPPLGLGNPLAVPLAKLREKKGKLSLVYTPTDGRERIRWHTVRLAEHPANIQWHPLKWISLRSQNGSTLRAEKDGSIVAGGPLPATDIYTLVGQSDLPDITGFRLEVIPDPSLPEKAAGRGPSGEFVLSRFAVARVPPKPQPIQGRYVRIEMLTPTKRAMTLAEVQAFSGGKNIAQGASASQSSTEGKAEARLAVDGNTNGDPAAGSVAQTTGIADDKPGQDTKDIPEVAPWWEVDLGAVKPLERIVIWNRTDKNLWYLKEYKVSILDAGRNAVWEKNCYESPVPAEDLDVVESEGLPLESAGTDVASQKYPQWESLRCPYLEAQGWSVEALRAETHVAVYSLPPREPKADEKPAAKPGEKPAQGGAKPAEKPAERPNLMFKLKHCNQKGNLLLGHFRIWVTDHQPPLSAEPISQEVPLLPEAEAAGR